jgi:four helix bundle protein
MKVTSYQDLIVWQRSMELVVAVYTMSILLPASERRGLAEQLRRAAVSVPSNIAEGHARIHRKEFLHFISIARASVKEIETQLLIAVRIGYCTEEQVATPLALCDQVSRMLRAMRLKLASGAS